MARGGRDNSLVQFLRRWEWAGSKVQAEGLGLSLAGRQVALRGERLGEAVCPLLSC